MGEETIESNTMKRKRLDARAYRSLFKKSKSTVISENTPERRDEELHDACDNPDDGIRVRESQSKAHLSHSVQIRVGSEVELQPNNGDSVPEQHGSIAQLNSEEFGSEKRQCLSICEYWVPVGFSNLQLEKYCEILIENSFLLSSQAKRNVLDAIHEVLATIRMCCDHPYLVDGSLEKHVNSMRQTVDYLTTGIEASGKLVLLDKILQDAKQKEARVLIVFQSKHSASQLTVRYILDDFIRLRFGEESYVHIYQEFDFTKRRAALDCFNSKESRKFVILIEKSSCNSSIKLSSMDFIILFNSDWSPINDLKSLQKMSIQSKSERLKVLRLYSTHSVEEKSLVLAKQGNVLDSTTVNFSHNLCHTLLQWGAPYLFKRLDEFQSSDSHRLCEHSGVSDDLTELLFSQEGHVNCSPLISMVPDPLRGYSEALSLCGEKDELPIDDGIPHNFVWISLLEGKKPQWKLLPKSFSRTRRKVDNVAFNSECETLTNHKGLHSGCEPSENLPRLEKSPPLVSEQKAEMVTGNPNSSDNIAQSSPWWTRVSIKDVEGICSRLMHKLLVDQIRRVNVFTRTKRARTARLKPKHPLTHEELQNSDEVEMKWKEECDLHVTSLKKVKQLEDMSVSFLSKKNLKDPISLSALTQSLNSKFGSEISDMVTETVHAPSETDKDMLDTTPTETVVLSVESDAEDDGASVPTVAPLNEVECNNPSLINVASTSAGSHCEKRSRSNREMEGNGSTNAEPFNDDSDDVEALRVVGDHTLELISRCLESDGENDIMDMVSGDHDNNAHIKPFNEDEEPLLSIPATEVHEGGSDMEGSIGAPSRKGCCVLEKIVACSNSGFALPLEKRDTASSNLSDNEARDVDKEPQDEVSNSETEGRDGTNLNSTYRQLSVENLPELPSSTLASGGCEETHVQTGMLCGNFSPSDLPVCSTNLSCNQITQTPARLAVQSCEIPGTSSFGQPSQFSEQSVDLGSPECPTVQTSTITSSPVPLVNNYFLGNSSSSFNSPLLIGSVPLLNELARMEKEKGDVSKSYETEIKRLRFACEKDIEEIHKKYELLLKDAENAFQMKTQALKSLTEKIHFHKLLADVLQECQTLEPTREALLNELHQLSIPLNHTSEQNTSPNGQPSAQPLQVHQLSDLITVDQTRPQICTVTDPIRAQDPHLRSSILPMHNTSTSYGMQNQLSHARQLQGATYFYGMAQPPRSIPLFHCMQSQQIFTPPRPQGFGPFVGPQSQQIRTPPQPRGPRLFVGPQSQQILAPPQSQGSLPGLYQRGYAPEHVVHPGDSQYDPVYLS